MASPLDGLVRSQKTSSSVIPAEAGIQEYQEVLDPGFRRGDSFEDFLRVYHPLRRSKKHLVGHPIIKDNDVHVNELGILELRILEL